MITAATGGAPIKFGLKMPIAEPKPSCWVMNASVIIQILSHLNIRHGHHLFHEILPVAIKTFTSFEWFKQHLNELRFRGCSSHA